MNDTEKLPDESQIDEMVESLSEWLSEQPHLPRIQNDKQLLRKFLINCKCQVEKTKAKIDKYYTARTAHTEVYKNRDPTADSIQAVSKLITFIPLPRRTAKGELVIATKTDPNLKEIVPADFVRYMSMTLDEVFLDAEDRLKFIVVCDFRGYSFQHFLKLAPCATTCLELMIEAFPGQFKGIHTVHVPSFINIVVGFLKRLVRAKFRDRFHVHKDLETFYDMVDRDILPHDLGGDELSLDELNNAYRKKIQTYKDWFKSQENIRSNEELRPISKFSLAAVKRSFKKLMGEKYGYAYIDVDENSKENNMRHDENE